MYKRIDKFVNDAFSPSIKVDENRNLTINILNVKNGIFEEFTDSEISKILKVCEKFNKNIISEVFTSNNLLAKFKKLPITSEYLKYMECEFKHTLGDYEKLKYKLICKLNNELKKGTGINDAIKIVEKGVKMKRKSWDDGVFITLVEGKFCDVKQSWIGKCNLNKNIVPWYPTVEDLKSEDWVIVPNNFKIQ